MSTSSHYITLNGHMIVHSLTHSLSDAHLTHHTDTRFFFLFYFNNFSTLHLPMYLLRPHSFALQVHEGSLLGPRVLLQGRVLLDMVLPVPLRSVRFGLDQHRQL